MADPFTIRIYVPDGDPEGVRIISRMNWTGTGLVFPRSKWSDIKHRQDFNSAGVYILTGYIDIETAVSSMKKGAVDYIPKPIKRDDFINVVKSALKKKNLKKDLNPFEILGLYLLDEGGVVIFHKDITFHSQFDSDMFGSMLTAVKTFMKDSFRSKDELRFIEHGSLKILIEKGKKFFIVVVGKGGVIDPIKEKMKKIVEKINEKYGKIISNWSGNIDIFEGIEKEFEILIPQFGLEKKSSN